MQKRHKILIVEDDADFRDLLLESLDDFERHTTRRVDLLEMQNGLDAYLICERVKFDLIILDLRMPILGGEGFTQALLQKNNMNQKTPIVVVSGQLEEVDLENANTVYLLDKPFNDEKFARILKMNLREEKQEAA